MKKEPAFEASMKRLEEIVELLENGKEPLDKSLKLFEEGTKLVASCNRVLENAELKMTQLSELEESGGEDNHETN